MAQDGHQPRLRRIENDLATRHHPAVGANDGGLDTAWIHTEHQFRCFSGGAKKPVA
jgi:hypothetical protein